MYFLSTSYDNEVFRLVWRLFLKFAQITFTGIVYLIQDEATCRNPRIRFLHNGVCRRRFAEEEQAFDEVTKGVGLESSVVQF